METVEQTKVALTPYDDKRIWMDKNNSEPYGLHDDVYNRDEIFNHLVNNCARRVNLSREKFVELLGCSLEECQKKIEENVPSNCSLMNYGTIWNIDHALPIGDKNLNDSEVLQILCHYHNLKLMLGKCQEAHNII